MCKELLYKVWEVYFGWSVAQVSTKKSPKNKKQYNYQILYLSINRIFFLKQTHFQSFKRVKTKLMQKKTIFFYMSSFASCADISCFIVLQSSSSQKMLNGSIRVKNYSTIYMFVEKVNFQIIKFLYPNTNHETIWSIWDQNCLCTCVMYIYILNNACTFEFCFYLHFCSKFFFCSPSATWTKL